MQELTPPPLVGLFQTLLPSSEQMSSALSPIYQLLDTTRHSKDAAHTPKPSYSIH